jgi:hypothetical protein
MSSTRSAYAASRAVRQRSPAINTIAAISAAMATPAIVTAMRCRPANFPSL